MSKRYYNDLNEQSIQFNKWAQRGLNYSHLRYLARIFTNRVLDLNSEAPNNNLIFYGSFYEGQGTTLHDLSSNKHNGTIYGSIWTDKGKIGNGGTFTFETINCVEIPHHTDFHLNIPNWSFCAWIYFRWPVPSWPNVGILYAKGRRDAYLYEGEYGIFVEDGTGLGLVYPGSDRWLYVLFIPVIELEQYANKWIFLTITKENNKYKLYINAEKKAQATEDITFPETNHPVYIGGTTAETSYYGGLLRWDGYIDELRVYNKTLTEEEIKVIYKGEV